MGETEQKLIRVFEEAKFLKKCIIFLDDLDLLCPKRNDTDDESAAKIVNCLLGLMDGAMTLNDNKSQILIIAATNQIDSIDNALRRPGRFDREIEFQIPGPNERFEILRKIIKYTKNALTDAHINEISLKAHGYVGSDLKAVVKEASIECLQRIHKSQGADISQIELENIELEFQDLLLGLGKVRPSSIREVIVQVPNVKWTDIGGQQEIKQKLQEAISLPLLVILIN